MYLKSSQGKGINVIRSCASGIALKAYIDADWAMCTDTSRCMKVGGELWRMNGDQRWLDKASLLTVIHIPTLIRLGQCMVTTEDLRLKPKQSTPSNLHNTSSAPMVLLAENSNRDYREEIEPIFLLTITLFGHLITHEVNKILQVGLLVNLNNIQSMGQAQLIHLVQAQQKLLAHFGLVDNITQAQRMLQAQQQQFQASRPTPTPPRIGRVPSSQAHYTSTA
nr:hypothetical protein [Tanacetum cinerariifolium]